MQPMSYAGAAASGRNPRGGPSRRGASHLQFETARRIFNRPSRDPPPPPPSVVTAASFKPPAALVQERPSYSTHRFNDPLTCPCGKMGVLLCMQCSKMFCQTPCTARDTPCADPPPYPGTSRVMPVQQVLNTSSAECQGASHCFVVGIKNKPVHTGAVEPDFGFNKLSLNSGKEGKATDDVGERSPSGSDESDSSGASWVTVVTASGKGPNSQGAAATASRNNGAEGGVLLVRPMEMRKKAPANQFHCIQ